MSNVKIPNKISTKELDSENIELIESNNIDIIEKEKRGQSVDGLNKINHNGRF